MAKNYQVKITMTAERDIAEIWEYIAQDSPRVANEFTETLERKITSLAKFPERNPIIPEAYLLHTHLYRHLIYQQYRIVFRIDQQIVYVLRVFHGARLLDISALKS